jgi:hypothetical protein
MGPRRRPGRRLSPFHSCALRLSVRLAFGLALAGEQNVRLNTGLWQLALRRIGR